MQSDNHGFEICQCTRHKIRSCYKKNMHFFNADSNTFVNICILYVYFEISNYRKAYNSFNMYRIFSKALKIDFKPCSDFFVFITFRV